VLGTVTIDILS